MTDIRVSKNQDKVDITIMRLEGADGTISCNVSTEPLSEIESNPNNAKQWDDYTPLEHTKITFLHGENEKTISIGLVKQELNDIVNKDMTDGKDKDEGESSEEIQEVMFKVKLHSAEPEGVKISKKNVCNSWSSSSSSS